MHVLLFKVQLIAPGISSIFKSPPKLLQTKAAAITTTKKKKTKQIKTKSEQIKIGLWALAQQCSHVGLGKYNKAQAVKMESFLNKLN